MNTSIMTGKRSKGSKIGKDRIGSGNPIWSFLGIEVDQRLPELDGILFLILSQSNIGKEGKDRGNIEDD